MLFDLYCVIYLIKIDILHAYNRVIKRLKHYFLTNAHCQFNTHSPLSLRLRAVVERPLN